MLKEKYSAIIFSVIIHLLLLLVLIYSAKKLPSTVKPNKIKPTAIKSFLYVKPKKPTTISTPTIDKTTTQVSTAKADPKVSNPKVAEKVKAKQPSTEKALPPNKSLTNTNKKLKASDTKVQIPSKKKFSSFEHLSRLKNKLDQQNRVQAFNEETKHRSVSSMHEPLPLVPKTIVPLTRDQQKELNTSTSHVSSITKNKNGTCTIHREQILGSPVEATTSMFACGEDDFDRSFRLHMQKVQSKLPIRQK